MRAVEGRSDRINAIWDAGIFVGPTRAHARVTIQRCTQMGYHYRTRNYRSINFDQTDPPRELPNVKAIQINRATDQDAATCTITFFNTKPLPVGTLPENQKDIDAEGWFTFSRGTGRTPVGGYSVNEWKNWLREDRILRTYQGYGINPLVPAEEDTNLIQTGTWLIDEVEINSAGDIVAICRDLAAFLIDQVVYPPVVPGTPYLLSGQIQQYPLFFEKRHNETTIIPSTEITVSAGGSSNDAYTSGAVYGHDDYMAFDSSLSTYWLSIGNAKPSEDWSYEWIQANVHGGNTISLRFTPWKGNYTVYVSVRIGGVWQGANTIPYNPNAGPAAPNGSNIKYVRKVTCGWEQSMSIPIDYNNVEYVRLTFTDLADSDLGSYQYRAGVRNFDVFAEPVPEVKVVGDFNDYTDLVKQLCAMGGFYWPRGPYPKAPNRDPVLGDDVTGRAWGDFETAGTGPVVDIPETVWDKKSLMDGINYVKEILGFIFFVDEVGGAVFRSPNIWRVGNFTTDVQNSVDRHRVGGVPILVLHEDRHLISYSVRLSNRNKRRTITVGTKDGRISATVPGDDTIPASEFPLNMERYAIYTDQNFASKTECLVMGELIKIRANFTFRRGSVNIKANPNIQPDDQVRIIERRTGESFLHYVAGISSTWEAATGRYDMELSTFWLGEAASQAPPGGSVVDVTEFSSATQDYLKRIGKI